MKVTITVSWDDIQHDNCLSYYENALVWAFNRRINNRSKVAVITEINEPSLMKNELCVRIDGEMFFRFPLPPLAVEWIKSIKENGRGDSVPFSFEMDIPDKYL